MAGVPERIFIFHIYRKDGSSLFLHPFAAPEKVTETLGKAPIEGRYGREPRMEALTMFRGELYRQVDQGVKKWLADIRFVPKFLIASAAFVVTYFFMSYVVRDPLPVIDELALGLAAAVIAFILQGRRDLASKRAAKKRLDLRIVVDRITFRESEFVKQVETALHSTEEGSAETVIRKILEPVRQELQSEPDRPPASKEARSEAVQFLRMLESRLDCKKLEREERSLRRLLRGSGRDFGKVLEAKKYDFPLYAVYKSFKKTVAGLK